MPLKCAYFLITCATQSLYDSFELVSLQSNNIIVLPDMKLRIPPFLEVNNDSAESVQKEALKHFKVTAFTSYTELRPKDSPILLVLGKKGDTAGEVIKGQVLLFFFLFFNFEAFF